MGTKPIYIRKLTETLSLSEYRDGWWLHDKTRGQNLSMRAKAPEDALVESITYYQRRLAKVEGDYKELRCLVDNFVEQVHSED